MAYKLNGVIINIDDYTIKESIGKGAFGRVFLAIDNKTKGKCALKVIQETENLLKSKEQMNILREVSVPRHLNHPGIVKMIGFRFPLTEDEKGETKLLKLNGADYGQKTDIDLTGPIIITEYMKNGSLEKKMAEYITSEGKSHDIINPTVRSKIIFGVSATMKYVHAHQVIHRDLKLENIFLDDNYEPRIADFGLSKVIFGDAKMTMAIGSPIAMAPELFVDGDETYSIPVDVYAYAFILYRMFSNTIELDCAKKVKSPQQYMMQVSKGARPKKPKNIPEHYWELIKNCWLPNAADRPTFDDITNLLKDDRFALNEFGMKTNLDELHEYQKRIDIDFVEMKPVTKKREKKARKTKFVWTRH